MSQKRILQILITLIALVVFGLYFFSIVNTTTFIVLIAFVFISYWLLLKKVEKNR